MSESKEGSLDAPSGLQWSQSMDTMLAGWCDEAKAFEWMNTESYSRYSLRATAMTITTNSVIALSGIGNLIVGSLEPGTANPSLIFGCISIGISIISMLQDKFDWITMANNFKQSSVQWSTITRKLEEQLAVPPSARKDCGTFLKYIKQDIAHVSETNYMIPKDIREMCNKKFGGIPNFDVPDICGGIEHTAVYIEELKVPLVPENNTVQR